METGAAREFRVLREGEAWRLELRVGVKWLKGHDSYAYLKDILTRLPTQRASEIDQLLPHKWQPFNHARRDARTLTFAGREGGVIVENGQQHFNSTIRETITTPLSLQNRITIKAYSGACPHQRT